MHKNTSTISYTSELALGIAGHLAYRRDRHGDSIFFMSHSVHANLSPQLFIGGPKRKQSPSSIWEHYGRFHRHVTSSLLGNHWSRRSKRHLQPAAYAFLDVSGTRHGVPLAGESFHIHSLWSLRPPLVQPFEDMAIGKIANETLPQHHDVHVKRVEGGNLLALVAYCAKFSNWRIVGADDTGWMAFPEQH